jgi:hypothetical protein
MALAILRLTDKTPGRYTFHIDTGSSPWWELVIGEAVAQRNNAEFVDGIRLRLPLRGPEVNNLQTGRSVQLSPDLFDNEKRFLQLFSYKTKDKKGLAFSEVIEVVSRLRGKKERLEDLPAIRIPQNFSIMTSAPVHTNKRSFSFEETPLSAPMSFAALMPLLTNLLPLAGNLLGGLLNKGGSAPAAPAPAADGAAAPAGGGLDLKALLTPENIKAVTDLITMLQQQNKTATSKSLSGVVSPSLLGVSPAIAPVLGKLMTPEAIAAIGNNPHKLYAALADAIIKLPDSELLAVKQELLKLRPLESTLKNPPSPYSEAKIAPALLAALPALIPLAEKALDGIANLNKEQNRHIEAIMPKGVNADDAIKQMITAINTYNAITNLPPAAAAPQQPAAQSVIVNALCHTLPLVEKALESNGIEELKEKTEELAEKIQNDLLKLQEDLKKKVGKMVPQLKIKKHEEDTTEQLSLYMQEVHKPLKGDIIFNNSRSNGYAAAQSVKLLTAALPLAARNEYKRQKIYNSRAKSFSDAGPVAGGQPDPAAELLLRKIEDGLSVRASSIAMQAAGDYEIEITGSQAIDVNGIPKVLYVKEKGIGFAVKIKANKTAAAPVEKALLQIQIKNQHDTRVIAEKKFPLTNFVPGEVTDPLRFEAHELNMLPCDCDLLVHFSFAWKNGKGTTKGTRKTHAIMLTNGYTIGHIGETVKDGIPLNNVNTHRNFWHKVWGSRIRSARSKVHINCKYYMHYDVRSAQNSLVETKKVEQQGKETNDSEYEQGDTFIKMKSGMEVSPVALNQLLPGISSYPSLSENQLQALHHYEFKKQVDTAARSQLTFRIKEGETNSLWVYPEVDLFKLTLKKANGINAFGNVLDTVDEEVVFVRPSSVHFIGTKNA